MWARLRAGSGSGSGFAFGFGFASAFASASADEGVVVVEVADGPDVRCCLSWCEYADTRAWALAWSWVLGDVIGGGGGDDGGEGGEGGWIGKSK